MKDRYIVLFKSYDYHGRVSMGQTLYGNIWPWFKTKMSILRMKKKARKSWNKYRPSKDLL